MTKNRRRAAKARRKRWRGPAEWNRQTGLKRLFGQWGEETVRRIFGPPSFLAALLRDVPPVVLP